MTRGSNVEFRVLDFSGPRPALNPTARCSQSQYVITYFFAIAKKDRSLNLGVMGRPKAQGWSQTCKPAVGLRLQATVSCNTT